MEARDGWQARSLLLVHGGNFFLCPRKKNPSFSLPKKQFPRTLPFNNDSRFPMNADSLVS